ncbi:hypothetical protein, partial [Moraxella canis]|uniref:hypothetical protein n=1 Tax=Moraxella canis TaxID=90239 RepID=UPI00195548FE
HDATNGMMAGAGAWRCYCLCWRLVVAIPLAVCWHDGWYFPPLPVPPRQTIQHWHNDGRCWLSSH